MKTITFLKSALALPVMILVLMFTSNIANAQGPPSIAGAAPMITPTGGFGIDGDVHANFGQLLLGGDNEYGDWIYDPGLYPGPGRGVLYNTITALPIDNTTTFRTVDLTGNADLNGFYGGSKFNQSPAEWSWKAGSSPQKDDMQNVMVHFSYDTSGDLWFAMAGDRSFVSGTSYIDFELFQKPVTTSGNGFVTGGLDGGRTVGDLAITILYSSGGDNPEVVVYRWEAVPVTSQTPSGFSYVVHTPEPNTVFAASNITAPITVPYDAFGSNTYPQYAFAEAAVNLFQVIEGIDPCIPIATVLIKTKSSDTLGAELKDMITPIQVNINQPPSVTVNDPVICAGDTATITAVASEGTPPYSYAWTVPNGVTNPGNVSSFSATVEGDYVVTVTDANLCVSEPDTATLTINNVSPGVIAGSQTLCAPFNPDAFTSTTPGSGDGTISYQWQMSTTSASEGFTDIGGATAATYDAGVVAVQTWYRRVATSTLNGSICSDNSNVLMVAPNAIVPGVIAGSQTLCAPFNPDAFTSTTPGSGDGTITYQWQLSTTSAVAGFSDIGGATSETYDAGVVSVATWFRRVATSTLNAVPCADNSNVLMVAPNAIDPGVIAGDQTLCAPFDPVAFTSTTPGTGDGVISYQWQMSTTSAVAGFSDIVGATSATYDAPAVAVVTWFRRVATSTLNEVPCADNSNVLMVSPNAIDPGVIAGSQTLCSPFDPVAFTSTTPGTGEGAISYQWQMSTTSAVAGFADIVGATSETYDAPVVAVQTWFLRIATGTLNGAPCAANSNVLMVAPNAIVPGVIAGSQTLCSPFDPVAFTSTTPGSGDGTISYQWQMSTTSASEGFADIGGATGATYDAGVVSGPTWFRRVATSTLNDVPCADNSNVLLVSPNAIDPGVIAGSQTLCSPFDPVAFTSTTPGTGDGVITFQWQMSTTSAVAGFSDIVGATSETYNAPAVAVVTWFRRVATSTLNDVPCADNSNVLMVTPNEIDPGSIAGDQTICEGEDPVAFTSVADATGSGTIAYQWQSSTDGITFADIAGATNATYDEGILNASLWYKRLATSTLNDVICDEESNIIKVTTEPCYEPLCSYTQGYYGNPGGTACDGENTYTTYELIEKALTDYPGGIMTIGVTGHSIYISNSAADINNVIKYLPGGKASYELSAGDISISDILFKNWYTTTVGKNNTTINNKLLAQTITLGLNIGMHNALGDFALEEGTFATAELDGGCGSTMVKERYCDTATGTVYNEYQFYTIMANIANAADDVNELFALANRALGNDDGVVGSEDGVSLNAIASAVDMINNAFDECRMPMGYGIEPLPCSMEVTYGKVAAEIVKAVVVEEEPAFIDSSVNFTVYPVPFEDVINVQYRFEYDTDVTIQVFNLQGGLIYGAVDNMYNNGEVATKQINLARTFDQALIVRLTTNKEKLNKNIVAKSSTQR